MSYRIKYNRTATHLAGIAERTAGTELNYAVSACPALSRSGARMATGAEFADLSEALKAAQLNARVGGRKMCAKCEAAAVAVLSAGE